MRPQTFVCLLNVPELVLEERRKERLNYQGWASFELELFRFRFLSLIPVPNGSRFPPSFERYNLSQLVVSLIKVKPHVRSAPHAVRGFTSSRFFFWVVDYVRKLCVEILKI